MQCKELSSILHHNYAVVKKNVQKNRSRPIRQLREKVQAMVCCRQRLRQTKW